MARKKTAAANNRKPATGNGDISWQAQKSAMTRDRILQAALRCLVKLGYTNITTAKVAEYAGVSRGAMLHHFPSKTELIQATVEYLHEQLLEDYSRRVNAIPARLKGKARRRAGLEAYWEHLADDLFVIYHELQLASRTDPVLKRILENSQQRFEQHVRDTNAALFDEWQDRGDRFLLAMDVTQFMMEGMATSRLMTNRKVRVKRAMNYLADRLEEIFEEGPRSAIGRHTAGS